MCVRTRTSLDGDWHFHFDPTGDVGFDAIETWRTAQVPMPWQAQFADLRHSTGVGWYRRVFSLSTALDDMKQAAILHFGAVDYYTEVWVNGQRAGEHEGGYLPFFFDVTTLLKAGDNEVIVRVVDPSDEEERYPQYTFSEIPHGKQSWYGPLSGIWQSVWLELRPAVHIRRLRLTPDPAAGTIAVQLTLSQILRTGWTIQRKVYDPTGNLILEDDGTEGQLLTLPEPPLLWSPDQPHLYRVELQLYQEETLVDAISDRCGFRTIEAKAGRIYLNGEPIYLRGALDQAYYPETIYTPPSLEFLEDQVHKAKALGLNCLRCHIKIEDPRYYEVADRLGILIWTEIPNWIHLSAGASQRVKETFLRMVERDWNHPSIIAWTLVNENWGTDLARNPEHRHWLTGFYHEAKQIDPYRLIVDNSACNGNLHVAGDIEDFHEYRAIPDHAAGWDAWVAEFAGRADWAWAADYAHERRADLPLIVSEFGNWGLPDPDDILEHGEDPWWFENGLEWGEGIVYPHGMRERFTYWGLDKVFGTLADFTRAHQEHMARSLAYELSTMRLHPEIGGYVITEFTDVHWECNGLMDMQRHVKAGLETLFTPLNQTDVVVVRPQQWSGAAGTALPVLLQSYNGVGQDERGTLHWQTAEHSGEIAAPGGIIQVPLTVAGMITLTVTWRDGSDTEIARNQIELAAVDAPKTGVRLNVIDNPALATTLAELGYQITQDLDAILVATQYTKDLQEAVQQGASLLFVIDGSNDVVTTDAHLPTCHPIKRAGTGWQGDWATSFSWLRKTGPFAALPGTPLLEMEYAAVMPDWVLGNVPARAFQATSWAGLALGWIHKPVSLLHKAAYGNGQIVTTTFKLTADALENHVIAQQLFRGCVELLR